MADNSRTDGPSRNIDALHWISEKISLVEVFPKRSGNFICDYLHQNQFGLRKHAVKIKAVSLTVYVSEILTVQ